jgi:NADH-quinone oxidoreductase subunit L
MFAACGVGAYGAGIFHLFTHGFFKALLFLGAGSVIHAMHHEQDMRKMGGLSEKIPFTWLLMLVGTLSLTGVGVPGIPFLGLAGYFSKDAIIEATYAADTAVSHYAFDLLVFSAFLTSFYSWRLMFLTFHGKSRADHETYEHAHESPWVMLAPLVVLALGSILAGVLFESRFVGEAYSEFWKGALFSRYDDKIMETMHHVPNWVGWAPTIAMLAGFGLSYLFYIVRPELPALTARAFWPIYDFLLNKWYFDELYDLVFVQPALWIGRQLWKQGDGAVIDGIGPDGISATVIQLTRDAVKLQSGFVYHYAFVMLIGVTLIVTAFALPADFVHYVEAALAHLLGRGA